MLCPSPSGIVKLSEKKTEMKESNFFKVTRKIHIMLVFLWPLNFFKRCVIC